MAGATTKSTPGLKPSLKSTYGIGYVILFSREPKCTKSLRKLNSEGVFALVITTINRLTELQVNRQSPTKISSAATAMFHQIDKCIGPKSQHVACMVKLVYLISVSVLSQFA